MSKCDAQEELPVIALGASAGGLEACRAVLSNISGDFQAALVLILHLDPTHDSMMVDLLATETSLKVVQVTHGLALQAGVVHIIPPGFFLTVEKRKLQLSEPEAGQGVRLPFDVFLRSLAIDVGAKSACVVLSGTGADGSRGVLDIASVGGLTISQDPKEAKCPSMPQGAIATGVVEHILSTGQVAATLQGFCDAASGDRTSVPELTPISSTIEPLVEGPETIGYAELLAVISGTGKLDISLYKNGTLERRVARRMALAGLSPREFSRYHALLLADTDEQAYLSKDLLIHVTSFFRDPDVFDYLSRVAIPEILTNLSESRPLRIWVAGCSTGEEAYSLAITCIEAMELAGMNVQLQVLASDVDPESVTTARAGFYSDTIENSVSSERLARFFSPENGGWRVNPTLRNVIVFTVADLLSDPPFSRIDLVSCRNVLIYLGPEAQKRVIARCCFALRPGGLLLLGAAEMPAQSDLCFAVAHKETRLWRRVGNSHINDLHFPNNKSEETASVPVQPLNRRTMLADLCRSIVLENYAPAAVLMNERFEPVYLLGPIEKYLEISKGHPDPGFVGMLPKALQTKFRAAAATCTRTNPVVTILGSNSAESAEFNIALHAVQAGAETLLLACFLDSSRRSEEAIHESPVNNQSNNRTNLEADLVL